MSNCPHPAAAELRPHERRRRALTSWTLRRSAVALAAGRRGCVRVGDHRNHTLRPVWAGDQSSLPRCIDAVQTPAANAPLRADLLLVEVGRHG